MISDGLVPTDLIAQDRQIAAAFFESSEGRFVTNAQQLIVKVNAAFTAITGYTADDAIGKTPKMLASGQHDGIFFRNLWQGVISTGLWEGEIWNKKKNGDIYPQWLCITEIKNSQQSVTHYTSTFSDLSVQKEADQKIEYLSFYDPLTNLANHQCLMVRLNKALSQCARHQSRGAILYVGLDHFRIFDKNFGHLQGDKIIKEVATRLLACARAGDTVARLDGDEFAVLMENLNEDVTVAKAQAEEMAHTILLALNKAHQVDHIIYSSTCSIGVNLFGGSHWESSDSELKHADLALLKAKSAGSNEIYFFKPQMESAVAARVVLEASFREAVAKGQFLLHYQPQTEGVDQIIGVEALVRWQHPTIGLVFPTVFIELAEDTGLIVQLGQWVLEAACKQLALWSKRAETAHLTMAVNVSALQFHQTDFVATVLSVLERTDADPFLLKLELTESLFISNLDDVVGKMRTLSNKGIKFSLDDFGVGYSSLLHLKRLPLDELKIDQGFIKEILIHPSDAAIAKMVISLGASMRLTVIAEGVETEQQRDFLALLGCHSFQGYFFSRPLPIDQFEKLFLKTSSPCFH